MRDRQSQDEIAIFKRFAKNLPYFTQIDSIKKGSDSEPDIFCQLSDGIAVYFELVECIDNVTAKSFFGTSNFDGQFPSDTVCLERIANKFRKKYSKSCELLVYYDLEPIISERSWLPLVRGFIENNIERSSFERAWIYSVPQDRIILVYPDTRGK